MPQTIHVKLVISQFEKKKFSANAYEDGSRIVEKGFSVKWKNFKHIVNLYLKLGKAYPGVSIAVTVRRYH